MPYLEQAMHGSMLAVLGYTEAHRGPTFADWTGQKSGLLM
jgi:hypothetical protein